MTKAILKAVRDLLIADGDLTTLLGGEYIYVAEIMQANQYPSVTLRLTSEGSKKRVSYNIFKTRDNSPVLQIDCWSKKSREETYKLADRIDELLISDAVPGTYGWSKISDSDMFEDNLRIFHKPLRYSFAYVLED
jgi:hypothetical protein